MRNEIKRILKITLGWVFIVLGIAGLFLPFLQGILFILIGLYILSHEYHWARNALEALKKRHPGLVLKFQEFREKHGGRLCKHFGIKKMEDK